MPVFLWLALALAASTLGMSVLLGVAMRWNVMSNPFVAAQIGIMEVGVVGILCLSASAVGPPVLLPLALGAAVLAAAAAAGVWLLCYVLRLAWARSFLRGEPLPMWANPSDVERWARERGMTGE